jgi:hypothetical protein
MRRSLQGPKLLAWALFFLPIFHHSRFLGGDFSIPTTTVALTETITGIGLIITVGVRGIEDDVLAGIAEFLHTSTEIDFSPIRRTTHRKSCLG